MCRKKSENTNQDSNNIVFPSSSFSPLGSLCCYWSQVRSRFCQPSSSLLSTVFICSLPLEHMAPTNLLQPARSWASQPSSIQVFLAIFISSSTVLLQVPSCQPLLLFPGGVHLRAEGYSCPCGEHDQATFSASPHLQCS